MYTSADASQVPVALTRVNSADPGSEPAVDPGGTTWSSGTGAAVARSSIRSATSLRSIHRARCQNPSTTSATTPNTTSTWLTIQAGRRAKSYTGGNPTWSGSPPPQHPRRRLAA
jgi:hypothetical protein